MGSLSRLDLHTLFLLLLVRLCVSFEVNRLKHGPSVTDEATRPIYNQRGNLCEEVPPRMLRQVLGSAYNEYYMSLDAPATLSADAEGTLHKRSEANKNKTITAHPFFVKDDFQATLSEEPAWNINFWNTEANSRTTQPPATSRSKREQPRPVTKPEPEGHRHVKRSVFDNILSAIAMSGDALDSFRWHCDAPLRWLDLGSDYFPRYILSVDCNHYSCQGERFTCEPRSFAVKVLRRRNGVCAPGFNVHKDTIEIGAEQMPYSLRQMWVWEMRAVSFCCVCQSKW